MQNVDSISRPLILPIDISTAGDNIIIAPVANEYIYIRQVLLTAPGGANTITIKEGTTVKTIFEINADDGVVLESTYADYPFWVDCKPGNAFIINLSSATEITGHVIYGFRS